MGALGGLWYDDPPTMCSGVRNCNPLMPRPAPYARSRSGAFKPKLIRRRPGGCARFNTHSQANVLVLLTASQRKDGTLAYRRSTRAGGRARRHLITEPEEVRLPEFRPSSGLLCSAAAWRELPGRAAGMHPVSGHSHTPDIRVIGHGIPPAGIDPVPECRAGSGVT